MSRRAIGVVLALSIVALTLLASVRRVVGAEMDPSLRAGDWVLLGPAWGVEVGDVVRLDDPSDPERAVLRRVVVTEGVAGWTASGLSVDGRSARLREMGRDEHRVVLSEADRWLIRRSLRTPRLEPRSWPIEGTVFLMADDREDALDSRHWGPLASDAISSKVWLRVGPSDVWRSWFALGAEDGPWLPPSKQPGYWEELEARP